jgi:hypothetical protein
MGGLQSSQPVPPQEELKQEKECSIFHDLIREKEKLVIITGGQPDDLLALKALFTHPEYTFYATIPVHIVVSTCGDVPKRTCFIKSFMDNLPKPPGVEIKYFEDSIIVGDDHCDYPVEGLNDNFHSQDTSSFFVLEEHEEELFSNAFIISMAYIEALACFSTRCTSLSSCTLAIAGCKKISEVVQFMPNFDVSVLLKTFERVVLYESFSAVGEYNVLSPKYAFFASEIMQPICVAAETRNRHNLAKTPEILENSPFLLVSIDNQTCGMMVTLLTLPSVFRDKAHLVPIDIQVEVTLPSPQNEFQHPVSHTNYLNNEESNVFLFRGLPTYHKEISEIQFDWLRS